MRRPRGKPRIPAEEQAAAAWDYAVRVAKALPKVSAELREAVRLTMYELERRSKVPRQTVSQIEGERCNASLFTLALIAYVTAGGIGEFARLLHRLATRRRGTRA